MIKVRSGCVCVCLCACVRESKIQLVLLQGSTMRGWLENCVCVKMFDANIFPFSVN